LIEKASETLSVERVGGRGKLNGELGRGCCVEALARLSGSGEEKLWSFEGGEWSGQGKVLVEEKADRDETGARIVLDCFEEIGVGGVEDDGGDGVVVGS